MFVPTMRLKIRITIYDNYDFCHFFYIYLFSIVGPNYPHRVLPVFSFEIDQNDKDFKNPNHVKLNLQN